MSETKSHCYLTKQTWEGLGPEGVRIAETQRGGREEGHTSVLDTHTQRSLGTKEIPGKGDLGPGVRKAAFLSLDGGLMSVTWMLH